VSRIKKYKIIQLITVFVLYISTKAKRKTIDRWINFDLVEPGNTASHIILVTEWFTKHACPHFIPLKFLFLVFLNISTYNIYHIIKFLTFLVLVT